MTDRMHSCPSCTCAPAKTEVDAEALTLRRIPMSYRQIAGQLGMQSVEAAHAAVSRALARDLAVRRP